MRGTGRKTGSHDLTQGLRELLAAGRRSVIAYRLAEQHVQDHRVQAAILRMRLDHERHVEELLELWLDATGGETGVLGDIARPAVQPAPTLVLGAADPTQPLLTTVRNPVAEAIRRGRIGGTAVLAALRAAEAALTRLYRQHVERGYVEPIRAALARHWREEEAHRSFVHDRAFWRALGQGPGPATAEVGRVRVSVDADDDPLSDHRLAGTE